MMKAIKKTIITDKNGFSLVEVLVSIVLIALLATMIAAFLQFWQGVRNKANELTAALNESQQAIESEYSTVRSKLDNNITEGLPASTINAELFGVDVTIYRVSSEVIVGDDVSVALNGGLAYTYKDKELPPIPAITRVEMIPYNAPKSDAMYFTNTDNGVEVPNSNITLDNVYTNLKKYIFRWYIGAENYHVLPLPGEKTGEITSVVALCPQDFELIGSEEENILKFSDLQKYRGRLVACLVIPGTIEGYMGKSVVSNYIYISNLPDIGKEKYIAVFDPSLISDADSSSIEIRSDKVIVKTLNSEISYRNNTKLQLSHLSEPYVYLGYSTKGTQNIGGVYPTRYLSYTKGTTGTIRYNFNSETKIRAFAVTCNIAEETKPYLYCNNTVILENKIVNVGDDEIWEINYTEEEISVKGDVTFKLGGTDVYIAEMILVANPDTTDIENIISYLREKYGIS